MAMESEFLTVVTTKDRDFNALWGPEPGSVGPGAHAAHILEVVERVADPIGSPDDDVTTLVHAIDFIDNWIGIGYRVTKPVVRQGQINAVYLRIRAFPVSATIPIMRSTARLVTDSLDTGPLPVSGPEALAVGTFVWQDFRLEVPHPEGKVWTYGDLDRAVLGFEMKVRQFTSENKVTQVYFEVEAEAGHAVPENLSSVRVSRIAAALEGRN
jgi:hypothetical protein